MRILVLTNMYPPHHYGGYEILCRDVVEIWRKAGNDVRVLTSATRIESVDDPAPDEDRHVTRALALYMRDHRFIQPSLRRRVGIERSNQAALSTALDDHRPDIVSVWHPAALSFGLMSTVRALGLPMTLVVGDEWLVYGPDTDQWLKLFKDRPLLGALASRLTGLPAALPDLSQDCSASYISEWLRERTRSASVFSVEPSAVHHPGVNLEQFSPRDRDPQTWEGRILFAGRIDGRKGIHFVIRALEHLPDATLDIDGRGNEEYAQTLRDLASELGVAGRVRFMCSPRTALADRYRDADVVVYPSTWEEPYGLVPLEAMACGTPVITTGSGGASEYLVDGSNCLIVPRRDERAIATQVARLANDPPLAKTLVSGGLKTAETMDMRSYADDLLTWHATTVDRTAP